MKTKMKEKSIYEDFFSGPWTPLFGAVPDVRDTDYEWRCLNVIEGARDLWEVGEYGHISMYDSWGWSDPHCPSIEEIKRITGYNEIAWRTAHRIYQEHFSILEKVEYYHRIPWSQIPWNQTGKDALCSFARHLVGVSPVAKDFHIHAIFAISMAWDALEKILTNCGPEEESDIPLKITTAEGFLREAELLRTLTIESEYEDAIKTMVPDAELGVKQRENLQKAREEKKIIVETRTAELHKLWQDKADEVWKKNPDLSPNAVAIRLSKESWPVGEEGSRIYSEHHIRKFIKKPEKKRVIEGVMAGQRSSRS